MEEIIAIKLFLEDCPYLARINKICFQLKYHIDYAYIIIDGKKIGIQVTVCEEKEEYKSGKKLQKKE